MENYSRKPLIAVLFSFFCVPVGYIYAGNPKKGFIVSLLILLFIPVTVILYTVLFGYQSYSLIFICNSILLISLFLPIIILVDVYRTSKNQLIDYKLKYYNKWWFYLIIFIAYNFSILPISINFIKENFVKAYKIPAGSMLPTLQIGDHILVSKFIYGVKMPFTGATLVPISDPKQNDIVVFQSPKNPQLDYIKRVIAVAGDTVEIVDKKIYINNEPFEDKHGVYTDPLIHPASLDPRDNFGPVKVPPGKIFTMGDNRDNSYDGRFWGFVDLKAVRGKAWIIYWSWDVQQSLFSLDRFRSIRWDRIGDILLTTSPNHSKLNTDENNEMTVGSSIACNEVAYDNQNYGDNMDKLATLAKLPDNYWNKYHAQIISDLCDGDINNVDELIDLGYVIDKEVMNIAKILGLKYKIKERTEFGLKYEYLNKKFSEMGVCNACASNIAANYIETPNSSCGKLAKKALDGNKDAIDELIEYPDFCEYKK